MQNPKVINSKFSSTTDDLVLWEAVLKNDEAAFVTFTQKYTNPLFNYGRRLCDDRDFLKDSIQDIFVDLWNRKSNISPSQQLKWYLFKSLRNSIFKEQAKSLRNQPLTDNYNFLVEFDVEYHKIIDDDEQELIFRVKETLQHLPPRQKEVIYLRFFEGLAFDDIADIMDISKQSAHNLLQKAYKTFREKWDFASKVALSISIISFFFIIDYQLITNNFHFFHF